MIASNLEEATKVKKMIEQHRKYNRILIDWEYFRNELPIAEVIDALGIEMSQKGLAKCIAHNDTNPSMHVSVSKNRCKCFACGFGGSPIDLVMESQSLTNREAVIWLYENFGQGITFLEEVKDENIPEPPVFTTEQYKMLGLKSNPFQIHSIKLPKGWKADGNLSSEQIQYIIDQEEAAGIVLDKIAEYTKTWNQYLEGIVSNFPLLDTKTVAYMRDVINDHLRVTKVMRESVLAYVDELIKYEKPQSFEMEEEGVELE